MAVARQIGGLVRVDVTVAGKLHGLRVRRLHTAPNATDQHFYQEFILPEEPENEMPGNRIIASEELRMSSRHS